MRRPLVAILAITLLALAVVPAARTQGASHVTAATGMERVRAAGIPVDPRAAANLEAAPIGSCPNDPMQPKCGPPPKAIRYGSPPVSVGGSMVAANPAPDCRVQAYSLWRDNDLAKATGNQKCKPRPAVGTGTSVERQWIWIHMNEYVRQDHHGHGGWELKGWTPVRSKKGAGEISQFADTRCEYYGHTSNLRAWRNDTWASAEEWGTLWSPKVAEKIAAIECIR